MQPASRTGAAARGSGLAAALLLACVPALPRSVVPAGRSGSEPWPDIAAPVPARLDGRRDAAVIISVEDYLRLPDRPGAHAVAGAWYRYLREVRGLKARRIRWLRDGDVSPAGLRRAVDKVHWRIGRDATLWVIFIGHAGTRAGAAYGVLLGHAAGAGDRRATVGVEALLARAGHGMHRELVAVLDGCLPEGTDKNMTSGLVAPGLPPIPLWIASTPLRSAPAGAGGELAGLIAETVARVNGDVGRGRREPADAVVFTAGAGAHCRARLPGTDFPALSYLLLGALRGWGDENGNDQVSAAEALRLADLLLRAGTYGEQPVPRPQARGADITLAREARERGPALAGVLPPGAVVDEAALRAEAGAVFVDDHMKKIDRGRFMMGCPGRRDPACEPDERPARWIHVDSYAIDEFEVTWRDYGECVAAGGCDKIDVGRCDVWTGEAFVRGAPLPAGVLGEDHPVVCATWAQAAAFCAWKGKRLPTEAEWERAARGPDARAQYPWGDAPPTCMRAQTHECGGGTAPVGGRPAGKSPDGIHDLAGNVAEWVADWYDKKSYRRSPGVNPAGPERGEVRVVRGGSYYDGPGYLRASYRYGLSPQWGYGTVGFRCAR